MVDGEFGGLVAKINFDAAKSYSNHIEAEVESKTLNTDNDSRDKHLKKEDYFSVEKFPTISMSASTFAKQPDKSYKGYFKLTLKGVTKDIVIPFTFIESDNTAEIVGTFKFNRREYGVGESSIILSDNVTLMINVKLTKK